LKVAWFQAALAGVAHRLGIALLLGALALTALGSGSAAAAPTSTTFYYGDRVQVSYTGGAGLRVRYGPGTGYNIQTVMREGAVVRVLAGPVWNNGYAWYKVTGYNSYGSTGWSAGAWLYRTSRSSSYTSGSSSGQSSGSTSSYSSVRTYRMLATGYNGAEFGSNGIMRNGQYVYWGAVAVDPTVIPLGTRMYIEGFGDKVFTASDTGSAIKGYRIDIWFPSVQQARVFGVQYRTIRIIR
jgi:3D (Asp-Asp-Asp) domain-containing protein